MLTENFIFAFSLTILTGLATGVGSLIAFILKRDNFKLLSFMLGFSAGIMIYVALLALLPEAQKLISNTHSLTDGIFILTGSFVLGIILAIIIDKIIPEPDTNNSNFKNSLLPHNTKLLKTGIFIAIVLAIHNFPEGISTFISALTEESVGYSVAFAMALHNIPEGIAISIPIFYATGNRKKAFFYSFLSGLVEPIGALIGYFILLPFINNGLIGGIFAFIAGIMSYISLATLIPLAQKVKEGNNTLIGLSLGFSFILIGFYFLF